VVLNDINVKGFHRAIALLRAPFVDKAVEEKRKEEKIIRRIEEKIRRKIEEEEERRIEEEMRRIKEEGGEEEEKNI